MTRRATPSRARGRPIDYVGRMLALLAFSLLGCTDPADDTRTTPPGSLDAPLLVPLPATLELTTGSFRFTADTAILTSAGSEAVAALLAEDLRPATGLALEIRPDDGSDGAVVLLLDETAGLGAEGYTLDVEEGCVVVTASTEAGLFYGAQTLRQLLPAASFGAEPADETWEIPSLHIEDAPRFAWRGFMLDVARHFFTVEEVKRQIDLLALHKMNRLHLHLTDDQGWRIEIASWPDLTTIGGSTEVGGGEGGFYTQADFAEIVAYGAARHVTVVPEIDFPGHSHAALASYPELNETGVSVELYTGAGVISTPLWLSGPSTALFVEDVWREVAALTPSGAVHIGGDEAIDTSQADYDAFIGWLQGVVADEGKTLIGWDEIGTTPLDTPFVAQHWYDEDNARAAIAQGGQILASPAEYTYLDMVHDGDATFGQTWAGPVNVETAYDWDPVPFGRLEEDVIGLEGALWTEYVDDEAKLDFMAWPRLVALSEVGWTAADARDWADFRERLAVHGGRLDALGVGYYATPEVDW